MRPAVTLLILALLWGASSTSLDARHPADVRCAASGTSMTPAGWTTAS